MYTNEINMKYLKKLDLPNGTLNTEGDLFLYPNKGYSSDYKLVKLYYDNQSKYFSNKMFTIHQLITNKEEILSYIPNLILPDCLVLNKSKIIGYSMDYVESVNLSKILADLNIDITVKLEYLKQIGKILDDLKILRQHSSVHNMFLNDIHEDNFIISSKANLFVVDMDACKIEGNVPMVGKYLTSKNPSLLDLPYKYPGDNSEFGATFYPTEQSDIYCYIIMILNLLYGKREVQKFSKEEYYDYLSYLDNLGLSTELLNIFENLYTPLYNINPAPLLEEIKSIYPRSIKPVYECYKKTNKK